MGVKNPRSLPRQSLLSQFLGLERDCEVCFLRAADGLGVNLEGGWHHLINCLLVPGSRQGLVTEVEDTFMNETDRIPSFRELSGQFCFVLFSEGGLEGQQGNSQKGNTVVT